MLVVTGIRTDAKSVWCYNADRTLRWSYDTGGNTYGVFTDGANNVYVVGPEADNGDGNGTRNIWKLTSQGVYLVGAHVYNSAYAWQVVVDGSYVYVTTNGAAVRLTTSLASPTNIVTSGTNSFTGLAVDSDGNIYIGSGGVPSNVHKYNSALALQWTKDPETAASCTAIHVLANGDIIAHMSAKIYYYKADGTSGDTGEWNYTYASVNGYKSLTIDSNDNIYAVNQGTTPFICLDNDGNLLWSITSTKNLYMVMVDANDLPYVCGAVSAAYDIWSVDTTTHTFTDIINVTATLYGIAGEGTAPVSPLVDKAYSKKLIAIANNQVWHESTAGTMSYLTGTSDIDTSDVLNVAVAFQKLFIANGTNLKVADFGNTKIATADVGTNPPDFGTILTGASGAKMIVDYITSATADAASIIYGKRTTTTTFVAGENVTGTNPSTSPYGAAVDFDMTAVNEVAPPHWYDYTVFGADATNYGTMPDKAYQICRYRGRIQLSGDPNYPHQWYQSRQLNPFDFLYLAGDAQSPVAGNNADCTEVGDIVEVAIPYSDDFLIFGCASELWVMSGDAAFGGELNALDTTTGILGDRAWCWDDKSNLYMVCTTGLLRIPKGFGQIENLTIELWPDFISDLMFNASLHRITLAFDPIDRGIHIFKTTLADGVNSSWWYDLRTEGLFPDSYSADHGAFSAVFYQAEDPDYRKLLIGCNDGYIRFLDRTAKNDDSTKITSYVGFAPLALSTHPRKDGIIKNIDIVTGIGDTDSSNVTCTVHVARTAGQVIKKLNDVAPAAFTKVFIAPNWNKSNLDRRSIRGQWAAIVLTNNTVDQSWSMERLIVDSKEIGRSL